MCAHRSYICKKRLHIADIYYIACAITKKLIYIKQGKLSIPVSFSQFFLSSSTTIYIILLLQKTGRNGEKKIFTKKVTKQFKKYTYIHTYIP